MRFAPCAWSEESRNFEGSRPLGQLGIFGGDVLAGLALRRAHAAQESGFTAAVVIALALGIGLTQRYSPLSMRCYSVHLQV